MLSTSTATVGLLSLPKAEELFYSTFIVTCLAFDTVQISLVRI